MNDELEQDGKRHGGYCEAGTTISLLDPPPVDDVDDAFLLLYFASHNGRMADATSA